MKYEVRYFYEGYMTTPSMNTIVLHRYQGSYLTDEIGETMAIKKEKPMIATNETEVLEAIGVELNNTAVSIVPTGHLKYAVVKIKFDAKSGVVGSVEVVKSDMDMFEAQHQFKVLTVEEGIFG